MLVGAAFCPHPPALVPEVAGRGALELEPVRRAAGQAMGRIAALASRLALVGSGPNSQRHGAACRGSLAGYGVRVAHALGPDGVPARSPSSPAADEHGCAELPLSLTVGAWLAASASARLDVTYGFEVGPGAGSADVSEQLRELLEDAEPVVVLVVGDGSARRSTAAPGYLDDRAESFDGAVVAALAAGQPEGLAGLDPALAVELLAAGTAAWATFGRAAQAAGFGRFAADVLYADAPLGVGYPVAVWTAPERLRTP